MDTQETAIGIAREKWINMIISRQYKRKYLVNFSSIEKDDQGGEELEVIPK